MEKLIQVVFIVLMSVLPFKNHAETNESVRLDSINMQIESLTHDVDYLQLSNKISSIYNDLLFISLEISDEVNDLTVKMYHKNFRRDLYKSYRNLYSSYQKRLDSTKGLKSVVQEYLRLKLVVGNFTDNEISVLSQQDNVADDAYLQAEMNLDMLKTMLDLYYKEL